MKNIFLKCVLIISFLTTGIFLSCHKEDYNPPFDKLSKGVSTVEAKSVAVNFFSGKVEGGMLRAKSITEKQVKEVLIVPDDLNQPALYIVSFSPTGFVIVSASQKEMPILGFSEETNFSIENAPLGLREWIELRKDKISMLKGDNIIIPVEVKSEWMKYIKPQDPDYDPELDPENRDYITSRTIEKGPLMKTTWGQGYGYNTFLTQINGQLPPTGCVATATAQVMKYHQFPVSYAWNTMTNSYGTTETARLMKDIGISVGMSYALDGSGAQTSDARNALVNQFGYSSSATYQDYNVNTVVTEISANRPVIFDGYATKDVNGWWIFEQTSYHDGHAWVCEGYRIMECYKQISGTVTQRFIYLYMNWGWNGQYNGYFASNNFNITFTDGSTTNFKYKNRCITSIHP